MNPALRRGVVLAPLLLALAIFAIFYARLWSYLTDDVFISVRYARQLVAGHGLVYNTGERVEGYTNFLWTLLLAPSIALHLPVIDWIKWLNALGAVAAALLTIRVFAVYSACKDPADARTPAWITLPGALVLASSPFLLSAAEGLETMMFTALLLLVVAWTWEAREDERLPRAAFALIALGLTRPDGWAFLPWAIFAGRLRGRSWHWCVRLAAVALSGLALHEIARLAYYGDALPNTLHAKSGGSAFLLDRGWQQLLLFVGASGAGIWVLALLPLGFSRARRGAVALLGAVAVRLAFHLWSGGPWMARGRFLSPVLPLLLVLAVWGAVLITKRRWHRAVALALVATLALLPGWRRHAGMEAADLVYGAHLRAAHGRLGADVAALTDSDAVMAMGDAGFGPLVANRTNIDLLGLNDRHLGRLPGAFGEKFDPQYVFDRDPDVIVLVARRVPPAIGDLVVTAERRLFEDPLFAERYRLARSYEFDSAYRLLLYGRAGSPRLRPAFWLSSPPARP